LYGAIHAQQKTHGETGMDEFLPNAWRLFWRFAGASLILIIITLAAYIAITAATGTKQGDGIADYIDIPISAVTLFWFAFLAGEGGLFASLWHAVKLLLRNPLALGLGIAWGLFRFADGALLKLPNFQASFAVNVAQAAAMTGVRVIAAMYAVALYRQVRGEALEAQQAQAITTTSDPVEAASNNGIINAGFGFAFAAFIPLIHIVALVLGILAIRRNKSFILKSAIAVCVGGFFTAFYAMILAGWLITGSGHSDRPGVGFLSQANPSLAQPVALLELGNYEEVQGQLESIGTGSTGQDWTVNCALAIARWGNNDLDRALESFDAAAQQKPDRSEFYFYYGLALLDNDQGTLAAVQFQNASLHGPRLVQAERYASLIHAAYTPPQLVSAAFTVLILLFLFTVHEFGHAYAAWKLGDNTARDRGRLTLNPIAHLDLFGSILLPGILLLRQSGLIFGWAKPVPVNPANFKDPPKDHMRVSFAGPAVNLLVAMACFLVLGCIALVIRLLWPETLSLHFAAPDGSFALVGPPFSFELTILVIFIKQLMYTSLVLGFFNLLPIPPLDGSWILAGILPQGLKNVFDVLRRFGYVIFLILVLTPFVDKYLEIPITAVWFCLHLLITSVGLT
jgi:Zn-dependent protease